jgi:hypothetical protein
MNTTPDAATSGGSAASGRSSTGRTGTNRARGNRGGTANRQRTETQAGGATQQTTTTRSRPTFKGNTEGMCGHVFECFEEQNDRRRQYVKTVEALDAYARKTLSYTADLAPLFATPMTTPTIERPENIEEDATDRVSEMIFAEEVKEFVKRNRTLKSNLATIFCRRLGRTMQRSHEGLREDPHRLQRECVGK